MAILKTTFVLRDQLITPYEEHYIKRIPQIVAYINKFVSNRSAALSARGPSERVHFTEGDRQEFLHAVDIPESVIKQAIKDCPFIDAKWHVLVDTFNILCSALIFAFYKNRNNIKGAKTPLHKLVTFLLTIRFHSAIQNRQFPYSPNQEIMDTTIENLSQKYLNKKFNSTFELLWFLAESNVENMDLELQIANDKNMTYFCTNLNTRISSQMKNITNEFLKNYEANKAQDVSHLQSEDDEGQTYLNVTKNISSDIEVASRKIRLKMASSGRIDESILRIAADKMHISADKMHIMLAKILEDKTSNDTLELISLIVAYYLTTTRKDISSIKSNNFVETMKSAYGVSNTKNNYIIEIKVKLDVLINTYASTYTKTMKRATLSNARGCIFLYFVLYISKNIE